MQAVEAQITASQKELEESKLYRQHQEECEVIKESIMKLPPRSETEAEIAQVLAETEELKRESAQLDADIEVRHARVSPLRAAAGARDRLASRSYAQMIT